MEEAVISEKDEADLVDTFYKMATGVIDEMGIFPLPMVAIRKDGTLEVDALATTSAEAWEVFLKKIVKKQVDAIILGIDRTTKDGQGTEFADVLTCSLWVAREDWTEAGKWREWFKFGVLNYQNEPRVVRPIDWRNEFWNRMLTEEIGGMQLNRRGVPL